MKGRALLVALLTLGACSAPSDEKQVPIADYDPAATKPAMPSAKPAVPASTSRDPSAVLAAFASRINTGDWGSAYLYWEDRGIATGLTRVQFAAKWGKLNNPKIDLRPGRSETAAEVSFYTAPVVLTEGSRRVEGEIVLRRVNDVPGASPEELRWHIVTLTVEP